MHIAIFQKNAIYKKNSIYMMKYQDKLIVPHKTQHRISQCTLVSIVCDTRLLGYGPFASVIKMLAFFLWIPHMI